jgi:hypothetical protein
MAAVYKHRQTGILLGVLLALFFMVAGTILELLAPSLTWGTNLILFSLLIILISKIVASILIVIEDGHLKISIARGLLKKAIPLALIQSCRIIVLPWYHFWGLRKIPNGYMYNITGFVCLEIVLRNSVIYQIGTEKPIELAQALIDSSGADFDYQDIHK